MALINASNVSQWVEINGPVVKPAIPSLSQSYNIFTPRFATVNHLKMVITRVKQLSGVYVAWQQPVTEKKNKSFQTAVPRPRQRPRIFVPQAPQDQDLGIKEYITQYYITIRRPPL